MLQEPKPPLNKVSSLRSFSPENSRQTEFKKLSKRLKQEKDRIRKLKEEDAKLREQKLMNIIEQQEKLQKEQELKVQQQRQQKVQEMHQKSILRKKELESHKKILREKPEFEKPLYVKLEENFKNNFELPELERRKAELAKKRLNSSINHEDIKNHKKKYYQVQQENEQRRKKQLESNSIDNSVHSSMQTKSYQSVVEETQSKKTAQTQREELRKQMLSKQRQYGNLVREMFVPRIDPFKKKEMQLRKEAMSLKRPRPIRREESSLKRLSHVEHKLRKRPVAKSTTPNIERKKSYVDYLALRRNERKKFDEELKYYQEKAKVDLGSANDYESLKDSIEKADKVLRKGEYMIKSSSPTNFYGIQLEENINQTLLESVRAKLQFLTIN